MAFRRLEEIADVPDLLPEGIDGPDGFCVEMGFKLCEGHFDWIEVRAIGWQEQDPCTPGLDGFLGGLALVGRQPGNARLEEIDASLSAPEVFSVNSRNKPVNVGQAARRASLRLCSHDVGAAQ